MGANADDIFPQTDAMVEQLLKTVGNRTGTYKDDWQHFRPCLSVQIQGKKYQCSSSMHDRLYYMIVEKKFRSNVWVPRKELKALGLRPAQKHLRGVMMVNPVNQCVESFLNTDQLVKDNPRKVRRQVKACKERGFKNIDDWIQSLNADIMVANMFPAYFSQYDRIVVPPRERFRHIGEFYKTLFHEIGHWTAHRDRCNRSGASSSIHDGYCEEELIAEIYSNLIAEFFGIDHDMHNSMIYLQEYIDSMLYSMSCGANAQDKEAQVRLWVNNALIEAKIAACYTLKFLNS